MTDTADNHIQTPAKARRRGFASMDPQKQREIASLGGRAAHRSGNAHQFTPEEARRAGSMSRRTKSGDAPQQ
jgi:general stress protein YciG